MIEKGAHIIASFYGPPIDLPASSRGGWWYRRRRPLFALLILMAIGTCSVEPILGQRRQVGGVRVSAITGPETGEPYLLIEFRGDEPVGIEKGAPLIVSAKTIIHSNAVAVAPVEQKCDPGCRFYERALFHVKRADLFAIAASSTAAIVILSRSGPLVGRLEFEHLAPIRRYVQDVKPAPQT